MEPVLASRSTLVEERITQLNSLQRRRNELLKEMFFLSRKQGREGEVLGSNETQDELSAYLRAHDITNQPGMGAVLSLLETPVYPEFSPPSPVPTEAMELTSQKQALSLHSSPIRIPSSPHLHGDAIPLRPSEAEVEDMDVDGAPSNPQLGHTSHDGSTTISQDAGDFALPPPECAETTQANSSSRPLVRAVSPTDIEIVPQKLSPMARLSPPRVFPSSELQYSVHPNYMHAGPSSASREPQAMQGIEVAHFSHDPRSEHQSPLGMSEDDVSALLQTNTATDPPLPITRTTSTSSQYFLSDLHNSILFSIPEFAFEDEKPLPDVKPSGQEQLDPCTVNPQYPLPPLNSLPLEFHRKARSSRRSKKEKQEAKGQAEWLPLGINRWGATLNANPVHKRVARSSKCLSTRDWDVAFMELKIIRTMERVEKLKEEKRWSFRQPKKQRGVGTTMKTHRDYLLDEMKWMRTDFREERKWKLALAYTLAHSVMEWHEAGSLEERIRRGICVLWKRPRLEEADNDRPADKLPDRDGYDMDTGSGEEDAVQDSKANSTPANDYGSDDDSDDEQDKEQHEMLDALDPGNMLREALTHADEQRSQDIEPKVEDVEDFSALRDIHEQAEPTNTGSHVKTEVAEANSTPKGEEKNSVLKPLATDPLLSQASKDRKPPSKQKSRANVYAPLRDRIVYSEPDKLFVDLDDFELVQGMSELSTDDPLLSAPPPPTDLSTIFPDLSPYELLDVAPVAQPLEAKEGKEGKKKSEKRDRDDPNKRIEETNYSRLVPTNDMMLHRPTLLAPLEPSKHYHDGHWHDLNDTAIPVDPIHPVPRPVDEGAHNALFGNTTSPRPNTSALPLSALRRRMPHDPYESRANSGAPKRRLPEHMWSPQDDATLKQLVEMYPGNWMLVAEAFNSMRTTISTEARTWPECRDRWFSRFLPNNNAEDDGRATPHTAHTPTTSMTTRGTKRSISVVNGANSASGPAVAQADYKRRRHSVMQDAIRKAMKKREQTQKIQAASQRKPAATHETHGQFAKLPRYTPAELSRMKAEKDAREAMEAAQRRAVQEQQQRQMLLQQQQRMQSSQGSAQQPVANGAARPPPNGIPAAQSIPQIRSQVNISQQQRMSAHMINSAAHSRALAQAAATNSLAASGAPALSSTHLAAYNVRATSASPQQSPPLPSATPVPSATSPRPPSAQAHASLAAQQAALQRPAGTNLAQYYNMSNPQYNPEIQRILLQQQAAMQQQQQQSQGQTQQQQQPQHSPHQNGAYTQS
ncbi:hypothetical protein K474DRAFT_1654950 [Panus rudis PR-1116 ss-1]|nr:hypothetical protein K474DRAFT_1654950 [Panus rudis PR-1116 ss-1]